MKAWRIASGAFPIMDGQGAALNPGRWNGPGQRAIYCGASFAITLLERLCYTGLGRVPKSDVYVELEIPEHLIERFDPEASPGWDEPASSVARNFGIKWLAEMRSLALLVPSAVTRLDWNVVINQSHPDFDKLTWSEAKRVSWDRRLFVR